MAILLTILMSLGLIQNPNVNNYTAVDDRANTNLAGEYGTGTWEWDNAR
jgi:hypothetical protein